MTIHSPALITALILGSGLGILYFGGLWLTIQRITHSKRPMELIWSSFLLRLGAVLGFFYLILQRSPTDQLLLLLLICFLGFLLTRNILINSIMPTQKKRGREE